MEAYAVLETGGKQYLVKANDVLEIERLAADIGASIELKPVLALSDGSKLTVGTPEVPGAAVKASVVGLTRGPKLVAYKKKRRKGYARKIGHRQDLTKIKIESIQA
jgi:large subunit ribosomal protein L21